ncbi:MAG TPA: hypothetical protein VGA31_12035 [Thermoanaerobaculia bacterium]
MSEKTDELLVLVHDRYVTDAMGVHQVIERCQRIAGAESVGVRGHQIPDLGPFGTGLRRSWLCGPDSVLRHFSLLDENLEDPILVSP